MVTARCHLDFGAIACPVMNAVGLMDHLVSIESNRPILQLIPHIDDIQFDAGHAGLILGGEAHHLAIPRMGEWIESHSDRTRP